ncbi:MAG: aminopeptidase P family protein [Phycisphaerales bacterium]|nr:aminopeptidase P family protein [Phycisphaerales bacterium]
MANPAPAISLAEFAARRARLLAQLKRDGNAIGLILAGDADASLSHSWRPNPNFEYLTGITDEASAILLLDPAHPVKSKRVQLFLRPLNPELEKWDGFRAQVSTALKGQYGIATILRNTGFARALLESAKRAKRFACLHALAAHTAPISADLAIFRESALRIPGATITDLTHLLPAMRSVKSAAEIAQMQRAADITALGFAAALRAARPGQTEFDVQEAVEHAYKSAGARETAYRTIAGSGFNATVLHYHANKNPIAAGELLVLDSGASFAGYAADVTRTFAVAGRFTARQQLVYSTVLKAQLAAIKACRVGATMNDVDSAARKVITAAGFGDYFIHGIGHHLGLEVHDADPATPLQAGMVITVEPGIYIPQESLGVRIEDDILVTRGAPKVLTAAIPK